MREHKFRGKCIAAGELKDKWVYGDLIKNRNKYYIHPHSQLIEVSRHYGRLVVLHEVDPETVGQYTGLKDRHGVDIYEGDTIQFEDVGEEGYEYKEGYDFTNRAIVIFENGRFTLDEFVDTNSAVVEELEDHEETFSVIQHSEVIGNRWDNPELLEVQSDVR